MEITANIEVVFGMTKEKRRFFVSPVSLLGF